MGSRRWEDGCWEDGGWQVRRGASSHIAEQPSVTLLRRRAGACVCAKVGSPEGLERSSREQFDYAIIDEVHHAHAPAYRRVMARLNCTFVLGLTATPERGDGIDVASIFDDNLAYHAIIGDGIAGDSLVPFHYVGIRDTVDFEQIPWRYGRFELAELFAS